MRRQATASPARSHTTIGGMAFGLACLFLLAVTAITGAGTAAAAECPNEAIREEQGTTSLPDCRAYEQVSPVEKHGASLIAYSTVGRKVPTTYSSAAGDSIFYVPPAAAILGEDAVRGFGYPYQETRTDEGWVGRTVINGPVPDVQMTAQWGEVRFFWPSADRMGALFDGFIPFVPDNPEGSVIGRSAAIYRAQGDTVDWLSRPALANPVPAPGAISGAQFMPIGGSPDLGTAFFMSNAALTADDAAIRTSASPGASHAIYQWRDGVLDAAAVLPDGTLDPGGSVASGYYGLEGPFTNFNQGAQNSYAHPVAQDGKSFTFVSPDPAAHSGRTPQLYLAREGRQTVQLTGPGGVVATGAVGVAVAVDSADGRWIVFSSYDALNQEAVDAAVPVGEKMTYRYDSRTDTLRFLPELTTSSSNGIVYAVSEDGSRILFHDATRLRLWREGEPAVDLASGFDPGTSAPNVPVSRFSADGRTVVLMSRQPLNGQADQPAGQIQIYRHVEGGSLSCISCSAAGTAGTADLAKFTNLGTYGGLGSGAYASAVPMIDVRGISADGTRVFFDTPKPLVPEDHNAVTDVYEWREGTGLSLISGGKADARPSFFADNGDSGDDLFFYTAENIGSDDDGLYDLYDARAGGGFAPVSPREPCTDTCQGAPQAPPPTVTPGSRSAAPAAPVPTAAISVRRRSTTPSGATLVLSPTVDGRLRASGKGLRTATRTVKAGATYTFRLHLRAGARRTLEKHGEFTVRVRVRLTPATGSAVTRTVKLTIRRPGR